VNQWQSHPSIWHTCTTNSHIHTLPSLLNLVPNHRFGYMHPLSNGMHISPIHLFINPSIIHWSTHAQTHITHIHTTYLHPAIHMPHATICTNMSAYISDFINPCIHHS
jgi:hypothetical protein